MPEEHVKNSRKKNFLFGALLVDIAILLSLLVIYYTGNPKVFTLLKCNNVINFKDCSTNGNENTIEIAPTSISKNSHLNENILLTIRPSSVNSYLSNPGIGWQHDINGSSNYLPETVAYSNRQGIGWSILNPAEGVYDWTPLDNQLSEATSAGKQFSFRIYTMAGESFGGHKVPLWVVEKGARIFPSGEPDYSNCVYQEEWGKFVQELINRYDGNPNIAFIDISGYGNFNEWSWQDKQTQWDSFWEENYGSGTADASTMHTIDSQARRRLADMFIGGDYKQHQCRDKNGVVQAVDYSYTGFSSTQLIMPYAGISQSTQYVFTRNPDIGFRYDSLGRINHSEMDKINNEISLIWQQAPVVYEFSNPDDFNIASASQLLGITHASLVHNNEYSQDKSNLQELLLSVGYRYILNYAQLEIQPYPGGEVNLVMDWQNIGAAPSYPKMGQTFQLHLYIINLQNQRTIDFPISTDVSSWMPAESLKSLPPDNRINSAFNLPNDITPGDYEVRVSIVEERTGRPINLAFSQSNELGRYFLENFQISAK